MRILLIVLGIILGNTLYASDWGGRVGLNFQIGSHVQRVGMMYQVYWFNNFMQISQGGYFHFNFKNLGPPGKYFESKLQLGVQGHWGASTFEKYHFNELSNMSPHDYHLGYSFLYYFDDKEMTQTSGAVHAGIVNFHIATENDAFGTNPYDDKFRTGAFYMAYQKDSMNLAVQSTLWTGLSFDAPKHKDTDYPAKKGYRDPSEVKYGRFSHGIFALRFEAGTVYNQVLRSELGIDSERIRNLFQNRLIHDVMPDRWVGYENPHYPMLQEDGSPYLFLEGQEVKKPKIFFQVGANQPSFY